MKRFAPCSLFIWFCALSCKTGSSLFEKKSLHEKYGQKLIQAGLKETALGRIWFSSAEEALAHPQAISVPYKEVGYFSVDKPRAVGLGFTAKRGVKLSFLLEKKPDTSFVMYVDLWRVKRGELPALVRSLDNSGKVFEYEIDKDDTFLLRLQPELLQGGEYSLSIAVGPSLDFPVGVKSARIGSFWGASRDEGGRRHEGIDIFAPKWSPALQRLTEGFLLSQKTISAAR